MLKKMNLPNKLTMLRIFLVPVFVVLMAISDLNDILKYVSLGIFLVAAITDFIDGIISRSKGQITEFGKIMDPLADKLLISSAFIMLTGFGIIPAYITAIIILRDFFANSIRMFGSDKNVTIAASISGKIKTFSQMTAIVFSLIGFSFFKYNTFLDFYSNFMQMDMKALLINVVMSIMIIVSVLATIYSLIDYIIKFRKYIDFEK